MGQKWFCTSFIDVPKKMELTNLIVKKKIITLCLYIFFLQGKHTELEQNIINILQAEHYKCVRQDRAGHSKFDA